MPRKAAVTVKVKPEYSQAITALRKRCGKMTQFELAMALNVTVTTVARWEGGNNEPDNWNYQRLANFAASRRKDDFARWFRNQLPPEKTREQITEDLLSLFRSDEEPLDIPRPVTDTQHIVTSESPEAEDPMVGSRKNVRRGPKTRGGR